MCEHPTHQVNRGFVCPLDSYKFWGHPVVRTLREDQPLRLLLNCSFIILITLSPLKATSHLMIFMRWMHAKGKIQRNNYQHEQCGPSFAGKTSSVSLIAYMHARKIAEWELAIINPNA